MGLDPLPPGLDQPRGVQRVVDQIDDHLAGAEQTGVQGHRALRVRRGTHANRCGIDYQGGGRYGLGGVGW